MKKILLTFCVCCFTFGLEAQITCTNSAYADTTSYTNGSPNDSLFFICSGQLANLLAVPPGGTSPWDFTWQTFSSIGNSWNALSTELNVLTSALNGTQAGGYRCSITDADGVVVGIYIVWVVRFVTNPSVNVNAIPSGCTTVNLVGQVTNGSITPYYNPPSLAVDPDAVLIVDATTAITVCFTGTHTFVSDLAFHLRGPSSCGSPDVTLAPSPGVCNGGNNISNLCFTTAASPNFDVCTAAVPLTGTYDSYGALSTAINWAPIYGCDASQAGWAVQIWDCVGLDFGVLTDATLTFSGTSEGGFPVTYSYTTPAGFSSNINDNSCSSATASTFTVPAPPAIPINFTYGYIWTAEPDFIIPNNTTSLNIMLNPGPTVDTEFTLTLTGTGPGAVCGGTDTDTEFYDFQPGEIAEINPIATEYCTLNDPFVLTANIAGGTWSGTGIVNAADGTFDPEVAGLGNHTITYTPNSACSVSASITLSVGEPGTTSITPVGVLCLGSGLVQLIAESAGGNWSGDGIVDENAGMFDPNVAGAGVHTITYLLEGICPVTGSIDVEVQGVPAVTIFFGQTSFCIDAAPYQLAVDVGGGEWSGTGMDADGVFSPAEAGIGTFVITYTVPGICESSDSETMTVSALPTVNAGADEEICEDASVQLGASGAQNYSWSPSTGLSSSSVANPNASPNSTVTYTVTGTDANGCVDTDQVQVVVNPSPVVTANVVGDNPICQGESLQLNADGLTTMTWTPSGSLTGANTENPTATPSTTTTYTVTGVDANGCAGSATATVNVIIVNSIFNTNPDEGLSPLGVVFNNQSTGSTFDWDFGNGTTLNDVDIDETPTQIYETGTYIITLTAWTGDCFDVSTQSVFVYLPAELFTIPNVITPNGKDGNEAFFIESTYFETLSVKIFNRWGKEVGSIDTPGGKWNPSSDLSTGTYYYVMRGEGYDGQVFQREGNLTILRDE